MLDPLLDRSDSHFGGGHDVPARTTCRPTRWKSESLRPADQPTATNRSLPSGRSATRLLPALCLIAGFIAPLIIYFVYRDRSNFVRDTSKEALNLQITAAIVGVTATFGLFFFGIIFSIAVPPVGAIMFLVWFILIIGYQIAVITFEIIGAVRANNGVVYRVPLILRLVK